MFKFRYTHCNKTETGTEPAFSLYHRDYFCKKKSFPLNDLLASRSQNRLNFEQVEPIEKALKLKRKATLI